LPFRLAAGILHPMSVSSLLRARIEEEGPIPFEEFMRIALYHPDGGFFASVDVLRSVRGGDFLTSPEVSDAFGAAFGRFVDREAARLGSPVTVIEVGAGSGSLLRPLLDHVTVSAEAWAVEVSPAARRAIARLVPEARVVPDLADVPGPIEGVVIANELVDNLPMAVVQMTERGWRERWVGLDGGELVLVDAPVRPEVERWVASYAGGEVPVGGVVECQLEAAVWLQRVVEMVSGGAVVVVDYGDVAENLLPRRQDGTLRTYRAHHLGPHPLDEPGATDITADVNFTALAEVARRAGAEVELWRQDEFLADLGLREELSELRRAELEAARRGETMERLRLRSRRTEIETLLHPRGLGDFRVLVARR